MMRVCYYMHVEVTAPIRLEVLEMWIWRKMKKINVANEAVLEE